MSELNLSCGVPTEKIIECFDDTENPTMFLNELKQMFSNNIDVIDELLKQKNSIDKIGISSMDSIGSVQIIVEFKEQHCHMTLLNKKIVTPIQNHLSEFLFGIDNGNSCVKNISSAIPNIIETEAMYEHIIDII